jgi:hypothetical protein
MEQQGRIPPERAPARDLLAHLISQENGHALFSSPSP